MRERFVEEGADRRIAALAAGQDGVVARRQLLWLGLSSSAVGRRVAAGLLFPVAHGAYAVGHPGVSREGRLSAEVLATGESAALGHWSAVERWGMAQGRQRSPIEVCVPRPGGRSPARGRDPPLRDPPA
jgi:hypothetical protein